MSSARLQREHLPPVADAAVALGLCRRLEVAPGRWPELARELAGRRAGYVAVLVKGGWGERVHWVVWCDAAAGTRAERAAWKQVEPAELRRQLLTWLHLRAPEEWAASASVMEAAIEGGGTKAG